MEKYFKNRKIRNAQNDIELHEIFLDKMAQKKEGEMGISERKIEVPLLRNVLSGLFFFTVFIAFFLFARTFQLQVTQNDKFVALAEENKFVIQSTQAIRGIIYDKNFNPLVSNQSASDLICRKNTLPESKEKIIEEISEIINLSPEDILEKIENSKEPTVLISSNVDHQKLIALKIKIASGFLPGFELQENTIRNYVDGESFAHIIGYQRKTGEKTGLEQSYDSILTEKAGQILTERDALGNILSQNIISSPEPGQSLILWLDSDLQKKVVEELKESLKNVGAKSGMAVAMNPQTGGVLALVSLPSYDNNLFSKGISQDQWNELYNNPLNPLFNRVISGQYPTGSTIKPLVATAALEENLLDPLKQIYCSGKIRIKNKYWPLIEPEYYDFRDWDVHGSTNMRKAIAQSCNVYFYTIGGGYKEQQGLGPSRIKKYLELFGWSKKTGIDLPGENKGFIPSPEWKLEIKQENWWDGDTYHLAIGQGNVLATPLQIASSFTAIANNGKLMKPSMVQEIRDKEEIIRIEPEVIRENFINPENLQVVREGMREAVLYGSSVLLNNLPVEAAAKTGTAEIVKEGHYHNWVTVFAPYDNPQIVLTVMVENVRGMQAAALPIAEGVLDWYFKD